MHHRTLKLTIWIGVLTTAAAACSSGDDATTRTSTQAARASSTSTSSEVAALRVVGRDLRFDAEKLQAPAGTPFTIVFDNRDRGVPHDLAVYRSGPPANDEVAKTPIAPGLTTQRLRVPALAAGRYFYQCDVHPTTMTGTLVVS